MEAKKNPKVSLEKLRGILFLSGLNLAFIIAIASIQYKSYDQSDFDLGSVDGMFEEEDLPPITEREQKPPPKEPPPPEVIEVVEDDIELEIELEIDDMETDEDEIIEIVEEEETSDEVFTFAVVEDKPVFPGCEDVPKAEREICFQQKLTQHINSVFKYPEISKANGIDGKVYVQFVIDKTGNITNPQVIRGVDQYLDAEALRIVKTLPKSVPAKQRGKPVKMVFTVPIVFRLQ